MTEFGLYLFSTRPEFIERAVAAGVDGIVVDWEITGKARRQANADTEINQHTLADLQRVRAATAARVICRINSTDVAPEVEEAIAGGADEILLPMVRSGDDVRHVLDLVRGRCGVGILIETVAAVECAGELARLPLARVYVGLNDLSIERGTPSIFTAVADGTVERVRRFFQVPFGFGGLTLPERGSPIPCRLLMGEMMRLRCDFTLLRRTFHADVKDPETGVPQIRAGLAVASRRAAADVRRDHTQLRAVIHALDAPVPERA
jgi:hypothetical protein